MSDVVEELVFAIQPKRESVVWQQNQLAEARYKLSPREQKLLLYVIAMIEPEAEDFGKCKVSVKDYAELTGLKVARLIPGTEGQCFGYSRENSGGRMSWNWG